MKKQKGFTLVEILGVITILGVLALIAIPTIDNIITKNREKLYNSQIKTIEDGLKTWANANAMSLPEDGDDALLLSLGILKLAGFVDEDIKDPNTNLCFSNDMLVSISAAKEGYAYYVDEESGLEGTEEDCLAPTDAEFLFLKGSSTVELSLGDTYEEPGFIVMNANGNMATGDVTQVIKNKDGTVVTSIDTTETTEAPYTITYTYKSAVETRIIKVIDTVPIGTQFIFDYTGTVQENILKYGTYKIEVWGASGGHGGGSNPYLGGAGGYSVGNLTVTGPVNIFVYVGGKGSDGSYSTAAGGFNGGGNSTYLSDHTSGAGGGATDVRIGTDSLYSRIIVAGGGGGGGNFLWTAYPTYNAIGGAGGGTTGIDGGYNNNAIGIGGTISSGFAFGIGGYITPVSGKSTGAGGGGGWYGGTASANGNNVHNSGAGGGSGWAYTASAYSSWLAGNPTDAANWLLNSIYYLTNTQNIAGNASIPTYDGTSTMNGNVGNGYVKITRVS